MYLIKERVRLLSIQLALFILCPAAARCAEELQGYMKRNKVNPFKNLLVPLAQVCTQQLCVKCVVMLTPNFERNNGVLPRALVRVDTDALLFLADVLPFYQHAVHLFQQSLNIIAKMTADYCAGETIWRKPQNMHVLCMQDNRRLCCHE